MMTRVARLASVAAAFAGVSATAQTPPAVTITRLQCGTNAAPTDVGQRFSDTYSYSGLMVQLTFSCYLIRHGGDYLIWDTGNPVGATPTAPKTSLTDLLGQLELTPAQVKYVGISHYHGDHTGQASQFPQATLLIGKADWDVGSNARTARTSRPPPSDRIRRPNRPCR